MISKVLQAGGRIFVGEDFVDEVMDLFPDTTYPIGKGFRVYVGKTANDLILFTEHKPVANLGEGTYVMTCPGGFQYAMDQIDQVREWTSKTGVLLNLRQAAASPSGLYGCTKVIQASCEAAIRKLGRRASSLAKKAVGQDERVVGFWQKHAKRGNSKTARMLLSAYSESIPKIALGKQAAAAELGMYGMPSRVVKVGLTACSDLHEAAGGIVANLHQRKAAHHRAIMGFFGQHAKEANCMASRLLSSCYPDCDET